MQKNPQRAFPPWERQPVSPPAELTQPGRDGLTVTVPEIPPEITVPLPETQDRPLKPMK